MAELPAVSRSRRALLGAGLAAVAASVARALGAPSSVAAAGDDGADILVASNFQNVQTPTILGNQTNGNTVLSVYSHGSGTGVGLYAGSTTNYAVQAVSGSGTGVRGQSGSGVGVVGFGATVGAAGSATNGTGVQGSSNSSYGVYGVSTTGTGMYGASTSGIAVRGYAAGSGVPSVLGHSQGNSTGVQGFSGDLGSIPPPVSKTGVYGHAAHDNTSRGVWGKTAAGQGVRGEATTGIGVRGYSASGTAGSFESATGTALAVGGRASFTRSGKASVPANLTYVDITPTGGLFPTSMILATVQVYVSGLTVAGVRLNYPSAGKARIYLSKVGSTTTTTPVGWVAFN